MGLSASFVPQCEQNTATKQKVHHLKEVTVGSEKNYSNNDRVRGAFSYLLLLMEKKPFLWLLKSCFILLRFRPEYSKALMVKK